MDKIPTREKSSGMEGALAAVETVKRKTAKAVLNNAGIIVSVFLLFVVAVVMTTDVSMQSISDFAALGLDFFILLFCSYGMYINMTDSGTKQGLATTIYNDACKKYEELKAKILSQGLQGALSEFCAEYIRNEIKNTRTSILANVGITYEQYESDFIGRNKKEISADLTVPQKRAIEAANKVKPIKLSPDMILKRGRGSNRRAPLGVKPTTKKTIVFSTKLLSTAVTSILMGAIAFNVIAKPDWSVFASVLLKMLAVVLNGFAGYQFGYENIVNDTVNYMQDQCDLMEQFLQFPSSR